VEVIEHESEEQMVAAAADRIAKGEVLAWFQGKSGITDLT
jgi:predicted NodU family carbamoyl transferase